MAISYYPIVVGSEYSEQNLSEDFAAKSGGKLPSSATNDTFYDYNEAIDTIMAGEAGAGDDSLDALELFPGESLKDRVMNLIDQGQPGHAARLLVNEMQGASENRYEELQDLAFEVHKIYEGRGYKDLSLAVEQAAGDFKLKHTVSLTPVQDTVAAPELSLKKPSLAPVMPMPRPSWAA